MRTVVMAIAVVQEGEKVLLRKTDPTKNPYVEPWALFGGRIEGNGTVVELLNNELRERWNFSVSISQKLWWDEDEKADHDGEVKRFIYIDALCDLQEGTPHAANPNEALEWVDRANLGTYELNPPTRTVLKRVGYISE